MSKRKRPCAACAGCGYADPEPHDPRYEPSPRRFCAACAGTGWDYRTPAKVRMSDATAARVLAGMAEAEARPTERDGAVAGLPADGLGCAAVGETPPWYRVWFDSPYYGILYGDRDQAEADAFIRRLARTLRAQPPAAALDVACGTGRHAVVLADLGYDVLGIDLSAPSIAAARRRARPNLRFQVLDMRAIEWRERFDAALNLFTSFGYFGAEDDERRVLAGIRRALRPGGELVIDFLNAARTVAELVPRERTERGGIAFDITRELADRTIVKTIEVDDPRRPAGHPRPRFQERVRALSAGTLRGYLQDAGLPVERCYGDYALNPFRPDVSDRLILVARKPER